MLDKKVSYLQHLVFLDQGQDHIQESKVSLGGLRGHLLLTARFLVYQSMVTCCEHNRNTRVRYSLYLFEENKRIELGRFW